jgi:outer membrane protein assembly factor BamB
MTMKPIWILTATTLLSASVLGCGGEAPAPAPAPAIDLGSSSDTPAAPAGNTEPEAKTDDSATPKSSEDAPKSDGDPKPEPATKPKEEPKQPSADESTSKSDHPQAGDREAARSEKPTTGNGAFDPTAETLKVIAQMKVKPGDWPQWGGSYYRNNVPQGKGIATDWNVEDGTNIKWSARLGSETYGNPVIANGKVYVGTNNGSGYLKRYPARVDLGCLLCFDEATGEFLWQHSSEKLPTGRVHDWPNQGICSAPLVIGDRVWFVSSRGEVLCLDAEGFRDGENDGPVTDEKPADPNVEWDELHEADVVWKFDMMKELKVSQHNMCSCSVTFAGNLLFVNTSNGVDEGHISLPQADAPSFVAMDLYTGKVLWTDNSPGENVLHGQWSSPAYGVLGGQEQVLFAGGDGWLYSFDPQGDNGKAKLLWKFDCNPKDSVYLLGGRATRNHLIGTPVIYDGLVYIAVGEDPEHGEGVGHLWCIDPTKRGDVSPTIVYNSANPEKPIAHKRLKALEADKGDFEKPNPNSALVWHYGGNDPTQKKFEETMHRTCGTVAIKNDLLFIADFSGLFHCLDVKTGKAHWTYDMLAASWASPLIVEDRVYIGDEDGDVMIFELSKEMKILSKDANGDEGPINMGSAVYTTPVVANNTMFIANRNQLFCIQPGTKSKVEKPMPVSAESD